MPERETDEQRAERYAALEAQSPVLTEDEYKTHSRRSILTGGVAALAGFVGFRTIQKRPEDNNIPDVLRRGHEFNESLWSAIDGEQAMAPTFARSESSEMRVNGRHGIREEIDLDAWTMQVQGPDGTVLGTHTMSDIRELPFEEMTIEHKCIEGWSHIVTWGGTKFSNLAAQYRDQLGGYPEYVSFETPDGDYYVGWDTESALHPQTLLSYELQGAPLSQLHGAPLRLSTPNKYGIKTIKRIGVVRFTDERPADYWGDRGYDWYAQL